VADILTLIRRDHHYVVELLEQITADPATVSYDETARRNLTEYLVAASSRHEAAEEVALWPTVRRRSRNGGDLYATAMAQEAVAKAGLDTLRFGDGPARQAAASEVLPLLCSHMQFEEDQVFPAFRDATSRLRRWVLGAEFALAKRLGPTRPHPRGPSRRIGLLTVGLVSAAADRARDRLGGRQV
jgi:hypothetical protein